MSRLPAKQDLESSENKMTNKSIELKELKGTDRQVKFANDVRKYVLYQLEHAGKQGVDQKYADKVISVIRRTNNAKFILSTFAGSFYAHSVLVRLDILLDIKKDLKDAKTWKQSDLTGFSPSTDSDDDSESYRIKDLPFEDKDAKNNEIIGRNTKILNNYFHYLKEDIGDGYYSTNCENKINGAISELKKIDYDVEKYQFELIKLKPNKYIFEINKRLSWLLSDPHTDEKIQSLIEETSKYINSLEKYNSEVKNLAPEKVQEYGIKEIDIKDFQDNLDDAKKNAKTFAKQEPDKDETFDPWFISRYPYPVCSKFIRHDSAVEVISTKKRYLNDDDIVGMQEVGAFNPWDDYRPGNYYIVTYKNINDTEQGKKMLKDYHEEKDAKIKRQQRLQKLSSELNDFIHQYKESKNYSPEKEFKEKYEDKLAKAEKIYERSGYMTVLRDYLAVNGNLLFIADYNGLDGDNWALNNDANYCVWVAKLSDEQLDKVKQLSSELTKLENDD